MEGVSKEPARSYRQTGCRMQIMTCQVLSQKDPEGLEYKAQSKASHIINTLVHIGFPTHCWVDCRAQSQGQL